MRLTKKKVQQRVLQGGKPLDLDKFEWDEETKTFSTTESGLVLDFSDIDNCTFKTKSDCVFNTGYYCTFDTGGNCIFDTGDDCTFDTGRNCTFDTGMDCTFKTGGNSTFKTGNYCAFKTEGNCTFDTGGNCIFDTGGNCIFDTGSNCVIVNRNVFEVIIANESDIIQIAPYDIKGYIKNGIYSETGKKSIIADGILSEIISKKGNVYKVKNYNKEEISYLVELERNEKKVYSHGRTIKEAKESLIYKLADRDTSKYKDLTIDSVLTKDEAIECYMTITGACSAGTRYFVEQNENKIKSRYTVQEIIDLTQGRYGNNQFKQFFIK